MAVYKRVTAQAGGSHFADARQASEGADGVICPHCHKQTQPAPTSKGMVCSLCGKALRA